MNVPFEQDGAWWNLPSGTLLPEMPFCIDQRNTRATKGDSREEKPALVVTENSTALESPTESNHLHCSPFPEKDSVPFVDRGITVRRVRAVFREFRKSTEEGTLQKFRPLIIIDLWTFRAMFNYPRTITRAWPGRACRGHDQRAALGRNVLTMPTVEESTITIKYVSELGILFDGTVCVSGPVLLTDCVALYTGQIGLRLLFRRTLNRRTRSSVLSSRSSWTPRQLTANYSVQ